MLYTVLFILPLSTSAQTVKVPDANLRKAINEALDKAPNAPITVDEMERVAGTSRCEHGH